MARHDAAARDGYSHAFWGGHGHRQRSSLPEVTAQQTNLMRYHQLPNWRGSATM